MPEHGDLEVLTLSGDLGLETKAAIDAKFLEIAGVPCVVVDLSDVRYIDSTAISIFVREETRRRRQGKTLCFVRPADAAVDRIFALASLDRYFQFYDDLATAESRCGEEFRSA